MQPLYIVLEVVVGLQASASYSFADSTISDLGDTRCRGLDTQLRCSPWHSGMNVGFVYFGCTLALGAVLFGAVVLGPRPAGRMLKTSVVLWPISGLGSIGVGLFPVNEQPQLHTLAALPVFLAQPAALFTLGLALLTRRRRFAHATLAVATLSAVGTAGFFTLVLVDGSSGVGAFERLALWPGYLWVCVTAVTLRRKRVSPS